MGVKTVAKRVIPKNMWKWLSEVRMLKQKNDIIGKTTLKDNMELMHLRIVKTNTSKVKQLEDLFSKVNIDVNLKNGFIYSIDENKILVTFKNIISNLTIDYSKVLDFKTKENNSIEMVKVLEELIDRYIVKIENSKIENKEKYKKYFDNMKDKNVDSLEEALQKILFYNSILWQSKHSLNGLGRLDKILYKYYEKDIKNKVITKETARQLISNFMKLLHEYYGYKSSCLLGDTGQIIILGGLNENDEYEANDLTYMFIEELEKLNLPDPKILLRVSSKMPKDLLRTAVKCISTGIGGPLLSNDDVIIEKLNKFGYSKKESCNYVVAACWEPTVLGISLAQNNLMSVNYLEPFQNLLDNEKLDDIKNLDELFEKYDKYLSEYMKNIQKQLDEIEFEEEPLMSLFIDDCLKNNKDLSQGGARNNDYGLTGVALPNLVNSILNIKKYVFENKEYTLEGLNQNRLNNFSNNEVLEKLKINEDKFGNDKEEIIEVTNRIASLIQKNIEGYRNKFGGKMKVGYSSPSYISGAVNFKASLDGRRDNEPFSVHISSKSTTSYTELIQFASKLDYTGNKFNGNVVDFMVSKDFIENNFDKFVDFMMLGIKNGFFQLQVNVLSSKILIEAKSNPEKYPNLIVRVWGFSAYFKDLPEEYKDLLIERALESEGNSK